MVKRTYYHETPKKTVNYQKLDDDFDEYMQSLLNSKQTTVTTTVPPVVKETTTVYNGKKIILPQKINDEILYMVQTLAKENLEIGGLLKISIKNNEYHITDYCLLEQTVSSTDFDISETAITKFLMQKINDPDIHEWRGWWHSHHNMGLFWSSTDNQQFNKLLNGKEEYKDTIGIVYINNGDTKTRYDARTPYGTFSQDDITLTKTPDVNSETIVIDTIGIDTMIADNVTRKPTYALSATYNDPKCRDYTDGTETWNLVNYPFDYKDLVNLTNIHTKLFKHWSIEKEATYWGINLKKLVEATEQHKEAMKNKPSKVPKRYNEWPFNENYYEDRGTNWWYP